MRVARSPLRRSPGEGLLQLIRGCPARRNPTETLRVAKDRRVNLGQVGGQLLVAISPMRSVDAEIDLERQPPESTKECCLSAQCLLGRPDATLLLRRARDEPHPELRAKVYRGLFAKALARGRQIIASTRARSLARRKSIRRGELRKEQVAIWELTRSSDGSAASVPVSSLLTILDSWPEGFAKVEQGSSMSDQFPPE